MLVKQKKSAYDSTHTSFLVCAGILELLEKTFHHMNVSLLGVNQTVICSYSEMR
jgi:hypothetical protein